ncbi:anaerobic ribonucleoside-triphosphate reductase activating protein [Dysosmobacter sp.]|uniref:anaerobic ribonucleoside-triphosphate reductase activating protein n=1 Tax=Dysosmobacter sp. TaxID=2591382 RepID=UPI002615D926|nr:anaerobic ribonucleoside-triphosphate reductase activating protein [Dysosmobacter sp.]
MIEAHDFTAGIRHHEEEWRMRICGLQKLAMVDFPGKLAATVFTGGCNLRCPFCHNAPLVTHLEEAEHFSEEEVLDFLRRRQGLLDGVVLSGGEPLLHDGVGAFLRKVRDLGFAVKLDTNGCFPDALASLLEEGLLDYVAMDIKNQPEKYPLTVGVSGFDIAPVRESVHLLARSGVDYEFRTTAVREFHTAEDFLAIGRWLEGAPRYFIQNFVDSGNLVGTGCHGFSPQELQAFAALLQPFFNTVDVRGI